MNKNDQLCSVNVPAGIVHQQILDVLMAWGMNQANATTTADVMVETDLRGVDSHGVLRIPGYLAP